jgi:hypothetical protein
MLMFEVTTTLPNGQTFVSHRERDHDIEKLFDTRKDIADTFRKAVILENNDGATQRWELVELDLTNNNYKRTPPNKHGSHKVKVGGF